MASLPVYVFAPRQVYWGNGTTTDPARYSCAFCGGDMLEEWDISLGGDVYGTCYYNCTECQVAFDKGDPDWPGGHWFLRGGDDA